MHVCCIFVLIQREVAVYANSNKNGVVKMMETGALMFYIITVFQGASLYFMMYYDQTVRELMIIFPNLTEMQLIALEMKLPLCILKFTESDEYFGLCPEWLFIELSVWVCFAFTMVLLMIKSRFIQIGVN